MLRLASYLWLVAGRWPLWESQASPAVHATYRARALYPVRNLSKANQAYKEHPYLLRILVIDWPNQVWLTDITCIPMAKGFCLSGCCYGLVLQASIIVATVEHDGHRFWIDAL